MTHWLHSQDAYDRGVRFGRDRADDELTLEIARLHAEVERLREALTELDKAWGLHSQASLAGWMSASRRRQELSEVRGRIFPCPGTKA